MTFRAPLTFTLVALLCLNGCAGAGQPKPVWETAPDVDLAALETFALTPAADDRPLTVLDSTIRRALLAAFQSKGYVESSADPDFLVGYEAIEQETAARGSPVTIGIGVGTWGRNVGGSVSTSVGVGGADGVRETYRLAVRAVDPDGRRELWVGSTTTIEPSAESRVVDRAVAGVMRGFPARRE